MVEARFEWKHQRDMRDVADRLDDLQDKVGTNLEEAAEEIGLRVIATAARLVNVDTGRLRASLSHEVEEVGEHAIKVVMGSNVPYADDHEIDYPYLRPAIEQESDTIERIVNEALEQAADEAR